MSLRSERAPPGQVSGVAGFGVADLSQASIEHAECSRSNRSVIGRAVGPRTAWLRQVRRLRHFHRRIRHQAEPDIRTIHDTRHQTTAMITNGRARASVARAFDVASG
jgi:hypothetical protein